MRVALLKMDHPCFFDYFRAGHGGGDFRLRGEPFPLSRFGDTVFAPHGDFFVSRLTGMDGCSRFVP